jgi:hypothetical protein
MTVMVPIVRVGRNRQTERILTHAKVDVEDAQLVADIRWCLTVHGYAFSTVAGTRVVMHRYLLNAPKGQQIDHINGDRLDNRRSNLRFVTTAQNLQNQRATDRWGSSRYRGVYWSAKDRRWVAQIRVAGKKTTVGYFRDEAEAAAAAVNARLAAMPYSAREPLTPPEALR